MPECLSGFVSVGRYAGHPCTPDVIHPHTGTDISTLSFHASVPVQYMFTIAQSMSDRLSAFVVVGG